MKTYDETTKQEIQNHDLKAGYTDPASAKAWVEPLGTSGMYMQGECYRAADGTVYRCKQDNCVWDAAGLPSAWEEVESV